MATFQTTTPPTQLALSGTHGTVPWNRVMPFTSGLSRQGIAMHWARQKIAQIMDQQTTSTQLSQQEQSGKQAELRKAVIDLALRHHLVSQYSSLVAVETVPARPEHQPLLSHAMKNNLPHGMQYEAVFGWPQTATPNRLFLLLGMIMIGIAWLWSRQQAIRR